MPQNWHRQICRSQSRPQIKRYWYWLSGYQKTDAHLRQCLTWRLLALRAVYPSCPTDKHPASWGSRAQPMASHWHRLCRELTLTGNRSWCQAIIAVCSLVLPLQYRATGAPLAVCTNSHPGCTPHSPILPLPPSLWFLRLHQTESPSALDRGVDIWLRYTRRNKHY